MGQNENSGFIARDTGFAFEPDLVVTPIKSCRCWQIVSMRARRAGPDGFRAP